MRAVAAATSRGVLGLLLSCSLFVPHSVVGGEIESTTFRESLDVQLVSVDVVVTDRQGRPVAGLQRDDFEVFEDGVPVPISHFAAVERPGTAAPLADGDQAPGSLVEGDEPTPTPQRVLVFVDDAGLRPSSRRRLMPAVADLVRHGLRREDRVTVVVHRGVLEFRARISGGADADVSVFDELARGGVASRGGLAGRLAMQQVRPLDEGEEGFPGRRNRTDADGAIAQQLLIEITRQAESRYREISTTLERLTQLIDSLGGVAGRKSLLVLSDDLTLRPGESLLETWRSKFVGGARDPRVELAAAGIAQLDVTPLLGRVTRQANASRVTLYGISGDARGFPIAAGESAGHSAAPRSRRVAQDALALQLLSEPTGGRAGGGALDADGVLNRVAAELNVHYSLAYRPPTWSDGQAHRIEVKVRRPALFVRHREGYVAQTSDERMGDQTLAALLLEQEDNRLAVEVEFGTGERQGDDLYRVPVTVKVPVEKLVLLPAGQFHRGGVSIFVSVRDRQGRVSPVQKMSVPIRIPNDQLLKVLGQRTGQRLSLSMRGGPHDVAIGVRDELGHVGATVLTTHTPDA